MPHTIFYTAHDASELTIDFRKLFSEADCIVIEAFGDVSHDAHKEYIKTLIEGREKLAFDREKIKLDTEPDGRKYRKELYGIELQRIFYGSKKDFILEHAPINFVEYFDTSTRLVEKMANSFLTGDLEATIQTALDFGKYRAKGQAARDSAIAQQISKGSQDFGSILTHFGASHTIEDELEKLGFTVNVKYPYDSYQMPYLLQLPWIFNKGKEPTREHLIRCGISLMVDNFLDKTMPKAANREITELGNQICASLDEKQLSDVGKFVGKRKSYVESLGGQIYDLVPLALNKIAGISLE